MYCTICKNTVTKNIKVHLDKHRQAAMFRCSGCDKSYKYKSSLNQHERVWHKKNLFQCGHNSCSKKFKSQSGLSYHLKKEHSEIEKTEMHSSAEQKKWTCQDCSKTFYSKSNLARHNNLYCKNKEDWKTKMFLCIACCPIKRFKTRKSYREHEVEYHLNKPDKYICEKCKCQFMYRHAYYYHTKKKCVSK